MLSDLQTLIVAKGDNNLLEKTPDPYKLFSNLITLFNDPLPDPLSVK
jgi:hypothetical protein